MEYAAIKSAINKKTLSRGTIEKEIFASVASVEELRKKRYAVEQSVVERKRVRRETLLDRRVREGSADLEEELSEYESEMEELNAEKKEQLSYYSFDRIKMNFFKDSSLSVETLQDIEDLKLEAFETLSERFVDAYFRYVGKCRVSEDDFVEALEKLSLAEDEFFRRRDSRINILMESLLEKIKSLDVSDDGFSAATVGFGIVGVVMSFVVFPVYIVGVGVLSVLNVVESISLKKSLDFLKVIEDNYKFMEKALVRRAKDEYKRRQDEINHEFSEAALIVQSDIDEVNSEIAKIRQQILAEFEYDGLDVEEEVRKELEVLDHSIAEQSKIVDEVRSKMAVLDSEIADLREKYDRAIKSLERRYIDFERIGDSKFFLENVLLSSGDPPELFKNPARSILFVFSDKKSVIDFVKLMCLQIRCNVSPSSANIEIWDIDESGIYFYSFRSGESGSDDGSFIIANTTDEVKESIANLDSVLQKRLKTIRVSYSDINQYNSDMVKLGSVTENYYSVFVFSSESLLKDEAFKRLLVSGPSVGIFVHIFVEREKLTEQYIDVLERVNSCVLVANGRFASNAVEAVILKIREKH